MSFYHINQRVDTAANWASNNPTPSSGEVCWESDTRACKIGNGSTAYASLSYALPRIYTATATIDFGNIGSGTTSTSTITVTGAVTTGTPTVVITASGTENIAYTGRVTAADTVTIYASNVTAGAIDPASQPFRATVMAF